MEAEVLTSLLKVTRLRNGRHKIQGLISEPEVESLNLYANIHSITMALNSLVMSNLG